MRRIVGRIQIEGDQPCAMVQPLRMTFDYALGQRRAHVVKLARTTGFSKRDSVGCEAISKPVTGSRSSSILCIGSAANPAESFASA